MELDVQRFPVVLGGVIDLDGLGSLLVAGVASKHVDLALED